MVLAIQYKEERNFSQMTLGFDTEILKSSIDKKFNKEKISSLEQLSIENAINFFNVIIKFCDGIFEKHVTGLSGAEAYNIFVGTVQDLSTLKEIREKAEKLKLDLDHINNEVQIPFTEKESLIEIINLIRTDNQSHLSSNDFMPREEIWYL